MINGERAMEAFMNDAFLYLVLIIIGAVFVYVHRIAYLSSTRNFCCSLFSIIS